MRRGIGVAYCSNRACLRRRQTACCGFVALSLGRFDREDVGSEVLPRVRTRRWRNGDCLSRWPSADRRPGAVKVLHPDQMADPQAVERFRREAQTAARLKHPNVVTVYDFGVSREGLNYQ